MNAAVMAAVAIVVPLLGGCAAREPPSHAAAVDLAACRARAEEVFRMQDRAEVYRADQYDTATRDSPFAGTGVSGNTTMGLSNVFKRQQMVSDCLNDTAGNVGTTRAAPALEDSAPAP